MKLEVFESTEALASIQEHWASLFHRSEYATPFQSPAWLLTWWSHYGSGNLHVITGWENGQLRAILPCFKHRWHGRSQCTLIGSGISDYLDPVVDPPCCAAFISGLSKHLNSFEWHVCDWQDLAADTPLRELPGFAAIDQVPCTIIPLRGTFESFWSARSAD
ncbi:MAG: hypothetical protein JO061_03225, partial [Acidobacteriaceae bacterium]|nr:hypothetical protein [Acidobacteriaceae bacterium]